MTKNSLAKIRNEGEREEGKEGGKEEVREREKEGGREGGRKRGRGRWLSNCELQSGFWLLCLVAHNRL